MNNVYNKGKEMITIYDDLLNKFTIDDLKKSTHNHYQALYHYLIKHDQKK